MPLFEYRCKKCGAVTEFLEKAGAAGAHTCDKCGSRSMAKMLSAFNAHAATPACADGACQLGAGCRPQACPTGRCPLG